MKRVRPFHPGTGTKTKGQDHKTLLLLMDRISAKCQRKGSGSLHIQFNRGFIKFKETTRNTDGSIEIETFESRSELRSTHN